MNDGDRDGDGRGGTGGMQLQLTPLFTDLLLVVIDSDGDDG